VLPLIAEHAVAVISFDFIGCGNSDAGFLTYGLNESADAETVLREAYKYLEVERLTVWGRSMGAVTAILFAAKNHKIVDKLVLDSPFRSLEEVVRRVIDRETSLPHPLVSLLLYFLKREIEGRLGLPLFAEDYMAHFRKIPRTVSLLLICSENDSIVPKQEVEEFYRVFRGDR
jgi:pimeloyl-ACP methyl ester carboxylesterase